MRTEAKGAAQRVGALLATLTLEEKLAQLVGRTRQLRWHA